jgi:hypothetical protein
VSATEKEKKKIYDATPTSDLEKKTSSTRKAPDDMMQEKQTKPY